jgi:hypothetical protein
MSRSAQKTPEGYVQSAILDYLDAKHVLAFRMNTGAVKLASGFVRFGVKGMADIIAFGNTRMPRLPRVIWIECKAAGGRQSEEQKSFQAQVEEAGHTYIVARSIDDVAVVL